LIALYVWLVRRQMKTILIVDDEADIRDILRIRLANHPGFRILEAANGSDALELTRQQRPDLIILDWLMPGFNGMEVLKALRESPELTTIPVIMMTVKSELSAQAQGQAMGVVAYLIKPFDATRLMETVEKALKETT
jgi:DNA-binding response OmpR family regulator